MSNAQQFVAPIACVAWLMGGLTLSGSAAASSAPVSAEPATGAEATRTLAPALMLAREWPAGSSPVGYWVSEKLDGVRAVWDGKQLRFRSGLPIAAPAWFLQSLPSTALDGELWLDHGRFDELSGLVRKGVAADADWHAVQYMIFDLPGAQGTFGERVDRIKSVVAQAQKLWLQAVVQQRVTDATELQNVLKQTSQAGGEGLVLHRANALWAPGRSDALLKFKLAPDEDARVVGHLPGKGRHLGKLGAVLLELPDGQRFALGTGFSDAQRANPPQLGSVVTYRYRDRTPKGLPRFASFLRVREAE